jgi:acylphosphatase
VIKGASAVDPEGNAGVLVSHPEGGTIGWAIGSVWARGIHLITPVGLEKLVPSVRQSVSLCGQYTFDYVQGKTVGMVPLVGAEVVTEIKALNILAGVDAFHVASGGVNGSEGSVTLVAEGNKESVNKAIRWVEAVKGEPSFNFRKGICETCVHTSPAQPKDYDTSAYPKFCRFQGMKEEELPGYLRNR